MRASGPVEREVMGLMRVHASRANSHLSFQLLLQLGDETPVGPLRDDLLRTRLDHPRLMEAEGVEPDGGIRVVFAPARVGDFFQGLNGIVITRCISLSDEELSGLIWFHGAELVRFHHRPDHPLGGNRMTPDEFTVADNHATEVLPPGPIRGAIENDVPDLLGPKLLGKRWKTEDRVDFLHRQQAHGLREGHGYPTDVFHGIDADEGQDDREEQVLGGSDLPHGNGFVLEISDSTDALAGEQFEAPHVLTGENYDRVGLLDLENQVRDELQVEISLAGTHGLQSPRGQILRVFVHVLHVRKSLGTQQFLRQVLGRLACTSCPLQPDSRRFQRRLSAESPRRGSEERHGSRDAQVADECTSAQAWTSITHRASSTRQTAYPVHDGFGTGGAGAVFQRVHASTFWRDARPYSMI